MARATSVEDFHRRFYRRFYRRLGLVGHSQGLRWLERRHS